MKLNLNKMRIDIHDTFLDGLTKLSKLVMSTKQDDIPDDSKINHLYQQISSKSVELDFLIADLDKELRKVSDKDANEWDMFENRF